MTRNNDIRDAVIKLLTTAYPSVKTYGEEIQQGFKRPAFFVQLKPQPGDTLSSVQRQKLTLIDIHYFSAAPANERYRDLWTMADDLDEMFNASLIVGDRALYIQDQEPVIEDEVLQYQITLSYIDSSDGILVDLDDGTQGITLPESELGYTDGNVEPMRVLNIKGE